MVTGVEDRWMWQFGRLVWQKCQKHWGRYNSPISPGEEHLQVGYVQLRAGPWGSRVLASSSMTSALCQKHFIG